MSQLEHRIDNHIENAQMTISSILMEKNELTTQANQMMALPQIDIRDRDYITTKTKSMIERCEAMLTMLEESFRPSVDQNGEEKNNLSLYGLDVYAKLVNVTSSHIRELRELNKMVLGIDIVNVEALLKKSDDERKDKDRTIKLSSGDLLKLIQEAGKSNQLNAINADFTVVDQNQPKEYENGPNTKS